MGTRTHTLLRLLPVLIGSEVPEGDEHWEVLIDLKDIVELALCRTFTDSDLEDMAGKIEDHRQLLQESLSNLPLQPKHHYI